jgi:hypothetical protein
MFVEMTHLRPTAPFGRLAGAASKIRCCWFGGSVEYSGMHFSSPTSAPRLSISFFMRRQASSISYRNTEKLNQPTTHGEFSKKNVSYNFEKKFFLEKKVFQEKNPQTFFLNYFSTVFFKLEYFLPQKKVSSANVIRIETKKMFANYQRKQIMFPFD